MDIDCVSNVREMICVSLGIDDTDPYNYKLHHHDLDYTGGGFISAIDHGHVIIIIA